MAPFVGNDAPNLHTLPRISDAVVEIGLLLPAKRAEALLALSRQRRQSVGHLLRGLIDQALKGDDA